MSHPSTHDEDGMPTLRPRPRRPFELSSTPPSPPSEPQHFSSVQQAGASADDDAPPSRTRSILNLTSSTLFGIYQPTGYSADRDEPVTPWGTGAMTPSADSPTIDFSKANIPGMVTERGPNGEWVKRRQSTVVPRRRPIKKGFKGYYLPLIARVSTLFGMGVLYGLLVTHLHDREEIAPVKMDGLDRRWPYLIFWGFAGVLLGEALPYMDKLWDSREDDEAVDDDTPKPAKFGRGVGAWSDVVRSIGVFAGIAFAIRRLPWQSTLQLSLTLALTNPFAWYLIDRSPPGFIMSLLVSLGGTALLLGINPALVPSPSPERLLHNHVKKFSGGVNESASSSVVSEDLVLGIFSQESVGVATWIASVLFVSAVCFGNIGRRLASKS